MKLYGSWWYNNFQPFSATFSMSVSYYIHVRRTLIVFKHNLRQSTNKSNAKCNAVIWDFCIDILLWFAGRRLRRHVQHSLHHPMVHLRGRRHRADFHDLHDLHVIDHLAYRRGCLVGRAFRAPVCRGLSHQGSHRDDTELLTTSLLLACVKCLSHYYYTCRSEITVHRDRDNSNRSVQVLVSRTFMDCASLRLTRLWIFMLHSGSYLPFYRAFFVTSSDRPTLRLICSFVVV